jgi:hypothetical protein
MVMALWIALWSLGGPMRSYGAGAGSSENAVKAAYLCRLGSFVDWPPGVLKDGQFTIAVMDDDGVAIELEHLLPHQMIKNRRIQLRHVRSVRELADAQILYIGPSHRAGLSQIVATTSGRPVLVVTGENAALDAGSMVNFMTVDHRVRFEISMDSAARSNLIIGSELLSVAARVQGKAEAQ